MAKKKIKATKSKKQAQENRYFFGALLTVAGLLVVGIAAVVLFGGKGSLTAGSTDQSSPISVDVESRFGNKWRGLGATDWEYSPDLFKVYIDTAKWSSVSYDEQVKRANTIGKDFSDSVGKNGGDPKQVNMMYHDSVSRDQMIGTYSGISGAQIQK